MHLWEGTAHGGDIIFVPDSWPHQVKNLSPTIAVATNYIDQFNLKAHLTPTLTLILTLYRHVSHS